MSGNIFCKKLIKVEIITPPPPPNVIPLTRDLGRSEYGQLYPCEYHYSQRGQLIKVDKNI